MARSAVTYLVRQGSQGRRDTMMRLSWHVRMEGCRTDRVGAQAGMLAACVTTAHHGDAATIRLRQQAPCGAQPVAASGAGRVSQHGERDLSGAPISRQGGRISNPVERGRVLCALPSRLREAAFCAGSGEALITPAHSKGACTGIVCSSAHHQGRAQAPSYGGKLAVSIVPAALTHSTRVHAIPYYGSTYCRQGMTESA